jgi:ABC-type Fe3+ transport system permease subunit
LSIIETTLVFAGIPAAVILVIVAGVYAGGSRRTKRYRPGRPFEFTPVWFLAAPEHVAAVAASNELTGSSRPAITSGAARDEWPAQAQVHEHATGGASDRW